MRGLRGKRIIVAGGATGIGAGVAQRLAEEEAHVLIGDVNQAGTRTTVEAIRAAGGIAQGHVFDLRDKQSIESLVSKCVETFGGLDGLAAVGADTRASQYELDKDILDLDVDHWENTLRVNLVGHMLAMRAAIPHMIRAGGGSIVSVSSGAAFSANPAIPAYSSSKAALHPLIRHVAKRWGKDGVRCNGIAPGWVMSEQGEALLTGEKRANVLSGLASPRLGYPSDIAALTAFLLSDDAEWLTGQVISVNGGAWFRD